jgi:hypothetical protein
MFEYNGGICVMNDCYELLSPVSRIEGKKMEEKKND